MTEARRHTCRHCGLVFSWKPVVADLENGEQGVFCCRGCLGAWRLIHEAGLEEFYRKPGVRAPTVEPGEQAGYGDAELAPFVVPEGDQCRIDLLVNGITCPACVWLLERMIQGQHGVAGVSLTYAARTASVRFDPQQTSPGAILATIAQLGYQPRPYSPTEAEQEARREKGDLLIRFGTALFLTMQLMAYAVALYAGYFQGIDVAMRTILQYVSAAVTAPVVFYCGWPFIRGAWQGVRARMPGMDLLIAVGSLSAFGYSLYAMLTGGETYFESSAMIVTFVLLGRLLELAVRRRAVAGLEGLLASVPRYAVRLGNEGPQEVPAETLQPGDRLLVRQGERVPLDALLLEGETELDESAMTGETLPVLRTPGDEVRGGSLNLAAPVVVQALRPVATSFVMRIAGLVREAQGRKPAVQRLADRLAAVFVPAVLMVGGAVAVVQLVVLQRSGEQAITVALAVILIACPCALGLAVPSAVLAACSRAAGRGLLVRGGDVIERLAGIDLAAFDKTGTLTVGRPTVVSFMAAPGCDQQQVLMAVAAVEQGDQHPLARSLAEYARRLVGDLPVAGALRVWPGRGVEGCLADGTPVVCGNARLLEERGIALPQAVDQGRCTVVYVALAGLVAGWFLLDDQLRPGGAEAVQDLQRQGIKTALVSGDRQEVVSRVAAELGIRTFEAAVTPEEKAAWVTEQQAHGKRVLMVGDGVNDAPALASASVSAVPAGSTDLALEHADLILEGGAITLLPEAYALSRKTMAVIRQNLLWACVYNMIGIPLAMLGLLTPVYAAAAMTASSLMVSLNSLRLLKGGRHG